MPEPIGLGWRVHSWWAVVVAVRGTAASPAIVHRARVTLIDDESAQEPFHLAAAGPRGEALTTIESTRAAAADAAERAIRALVSSLGAVATIGIVGGDRKLPDLARVLSAHALLHAAERDLYERAVAEGATRAGLPVTTVPATGKLFADASAVLGEPLEPLLARVGKEVGSPWHKDHREATAAALVALHALPSDRG